MPSKIPQIDANTFALHWQASQSYEELVSWVRSQLGVGDDVSDREIRQYLSNKASGLRKLGLPLKSYRPRRIAETITVLDPERARQALAAQRLLNEVDGSPDQVTG